MLSRLLEYAACVWQTASFEQLEKIQRKYLAVRVGAPSTAGLDALEVECGVLPLDLRKEDLAVREIIAKYNSQKIEECVVEK